MQDAQDADTRTNKALRIALCVRETDELQRLRNEVLAHRGPLPPLVVGEYYRVNQKVKDKYQSKIGQDSVRIGRKYRFNSSWPVNVIRYKGTVEAVPVSVAEAIKPDIEGNLLYAFELPTTKLLFNTRGTDVLTKELLFELHELHEVRLRRAVPDGDVRRFVKSNSDDPEAWGIESEGVYVPQFSLQYAVGVAYEPTEDRAFLQQLFEFSSPTRAWQMLHASEVFGHAFPAHERDADIRAIYNCVVKSAYVDMTLFHHPATFHKGVMFEFREDLFDHHPEAKGWSDAETLSSSEEDGVD